MNQQRIPQLSIIVPTFNETAHLPTLVDSLRQQRGIDFELIVVDGGSDDETPGMVEALAAEGAFPVTLMASMAGRGRQFNAGAERARGESLLFLHADSRFSDPHALADGLLFFDRTLELRGDDRAAGHFALRFDHSGPSPRLGYVFFEGKARLNRPGCIHGDQGFLVRRSFFQRIGPFDCRMPFLEDEGFAAAVFKDGEWVLLPAEIHTSARRFETEGLFRRQLLNALIMNAAAIGWHEFLDQAPGLYRRQGDSGRLELLPFFQGLQRLFKEMPHDQRRRTWYRSGTYVRNNAWQLLFAVDAWRGLRRNPARRGDNTSVLDRWEPWVDRCSDHPGGRLLATALVWAWFHVTLTTLQLRTKLSAIIHPKGKDHAADRL